MNDELNNQNNINQENNNLNNEKVNNVINEVEDTNVNINKQNNNLEQNNQNINNDNKNNSSIPVIIMFIILLLFVFIFLGGGNNLFSSNEKQEQNNGLIDNDEEEENSGENNTPEKDYAKLEKMVLDEYYLRTTDTVDSHVLNGLKYSQIIYDSISYDEIYKAHMLSLIINSLDEVSHVGCSDGNGVSHVKDEYDKNGVKYPDYCGDNRGSCIQNIAKDFGLSVEEISKMDKNVWNTTGGQYCYIMYDAKQIEEKYPDIYKEMFSSSFSTSLSPYFTSCGCGFNYDKNLNKVITTDYSGCNIDFYKSAIIETKTEGNLYKIKYVEGFVKNDFVNNEYILDVNNSFNYNFYINNVDNIKIGDYDNISKVLKDNKDKLPNYEITFEKTEKGYKYKNIKRIDNNKINYEIKEEVDSNTGSKWYYLYVNNKKVNNIKAYEDLGNIEVKEFKDLLIVDEQNPGPSRRLLVVDKNGTASEIDYKVDAGSSKLSFASYSGELITRIASYSIIGDYIHIYINRQFGNGDLNWYCHYNDENEVLNYRIMYKYVNGRLENKEVLDEETVGVYQTQKCN